MTILLTALLTLVVAVLPAMAQEEQSRLRIEIPADMLAERQTTTVTQPNPRMDLTIPTVFYVAAVSGSWAGASATCVADDICKTVTPVLPTVGSPMKALGWGLLIQGGMLWAVHQWVAPTWPRVAQGILYGLSALHIASGTDHVLTSRRQSKAAYGIEP
jgi:hypothetical protein